MSVYIPEKLWPVFNGQWMIYDKFGIYDRPYENEAVCIEVINRIMEELQNV